MLLAGGHSWQISTMKGRDPEEGSKAAEVKGVSVQNFRDPELRKADMQKKWSGAAQQCRAYCTTGAEKTVPDLSVQRQQPAGSDHEQAGPDTLSQRPAGPELLPAPSTSRPSLSEHGVPRTQPAFPGRKRRRWHRLKAKKCPDSEFELWAGRRLSKRGCFSQKRLNYT